MQRINMARLRKAPRTKYVGMSTSIFPSPCVVGSSECLTCPFTCMQYQGGIISEERKFLRRDLINYISLNFYIQQCYSVHYGWLQGAIGHSALRILRSAYRIPCAGQRSFSLIIRIFSYLSLESSGDLIYWSNMGFEGGAAKWRRFRRAN